MLFRKNGLWRFCTEKVKYIQQGEEIEQYVGQEGHGWWIEFEQKWEHTEIVEFIPIDPPTEEQLARLEEINQLDILDGYVDICIDYVYEGKFPEGVNHPLLQLQLMRENEQQGIKLSELTAKNAELEQLVADLASLQLEVLMGG